METQYVVWCSGCSAEPAVELLDIEWNGEWIAFPVGISCLTRAQDNARIEEQADGDTP